MNKGFTLLETILYIALLGILMSSVLLCVFTLSQNADRFETKNTASDEGAFVIAKLQWVIGNAASVVAPTGYGTSLTVIENDGTQIDVRLLKGVIEIRRGGSSSFVALTSSNISVTTLGFQKNSGVTVDIEASTTIAGVVFTTRRYLPK